MHRSGENNPQFTFKNKQRSKTQHAVTAASATASGASGSAQQQQNIDLGKNTHLRRLALFEHSLKQHYVQKATNTNSTDVNELLRAYRFPSDRHNETIDRTTSLFASFPPFPPSKIDANLQLIRDMFQHGYDSYMYHGWPQAEVHPITCQPGTFDLVKLDALTAIDALDTLLVLGNTTEFARAVERLRTIRDTLFAVDVNVSVFETNIRVMGGLLSAHQLALALNLHQPELLLAQQQQPIRTGEEPPFGGAIPQRHVFSRADGSVLWGALDDDESVEDAVCSAGIGLDDDHGNTLKEQQQQVTVPCDKQSLSLQDCATVVHAPAVSSPKRKTDNNESSKNQTKVELFWKYDGLLLDLAIDLGERLLPAFATKTGIPFGTVNLLYGVPAFETTVASLAGGGTLSLEMELLSRLSGDDRFGKAAKLASRALFMRRSKIDLLGKHIDIQEGYWSETLSGIGSNSDSYLEYLAKHYFLFPEDEDFWMMLSTAYAGVFDESRIGEWYVDTDMTSGIKSGGGARRVLESLAAFYPGLQALLGEITPAARSLNSFSMVREVLGFLPERFNYGVWNLDLQRDGAGKHPLRPELLESCYFLHRATKGIKADPSSTSGWQWANDFALHKLENATRAECGYAGLREVRPHTTGMIDGSNNKGIHWLNEMPSFFLSETLKYLYLTFDENNMLHRDNDRQWIFTTEAHPIHYVPKKRSQKNSSGNDDDKVGENSFVDDIEALKTILLDRVRGKESHFGNSRSRFKRDLYDEKWTEKSRHNSFHDELKKLSKLSILRQSRRSLNQTKRFSPFVPSGPLTVDSFGEVRKQSNAAHLAQLDHGSGPYLRKACPNVYSFDLLWNQALSGGATDFSDLYISVTQDFLKDHPIYFPLLGAVEALGAQGSGVYCDEKDQQDRLCPITPHGPKSSAPSSTSSQVQVEEDLDNGTTIYKVPSDLGNFEISTYADGTGFHVHRVNSGERMAANFIFDEEFGHVERIAMIYTELRTKIQATKTTAEVQPIDEIDKEAMGEKEVPPPPPQEMRRSLSVTDFDSNAYVCEIHLIGRNLARFSEDKAQIGSKDEEVLTSFPCSPGMFGPSQISQLVQQGDEIVVEAVILGPREGNPNGCQMESTQYYSSNGTVSEDLDPNLVSDSETSSSERPGDSSCDNRCVHVVHRGGCTFVSKAVNMEKVWNAAAVVVINSMDELFLMSSDGPNEGVLPDDTPLTVMVTHQDGEKMLELMHEEASRFSAIFGRISLDRQINSLSPTGTIVNANGESSPDNIQWPVIFGQGNVLQILAELGWGIQAIRGLHDEKQEWQLQLLKHGDLDPAAGRSE